MRELASTWIHHPRTLTSKVRNTETTVFYLLVVFVLIRFAVARQYLHYAIQFTPQYGDSFLELLRLFFLRRAGDADTSLVEQVRSEHLKIIWVVRGLLYVVAMLLRGSKLRCPVVQVQKVSLRRTGGGGLQLVIAPICSDNGTCRY